MDPHLINLEAGNIFETGFLKSSDDLDFAAFENLEGMLPAVSGLLDWPISLN
jgi:hypothetical protein